MSVGGRRWGPKPDPDTDDRVGDALLLVLERLAEQGVNAFLRADPERLREGGPAWTFFAAGGPLPDPVRIDARTPGDCLRRAVPRLRAAGLEVPR